MTKILFICWGNICRSPAAEYLFNDMAARASLDADFRADSAGVSDEEEGSGVYPPVRRQLEERGIDCSEKTARGLRAEDYAAHDLLVCMDAVTAARTLRFFGGDAGSKIKNLLDYAGRSGEEIDDPWYTRDFDTALALIETGCRALLETLSGTVTLDLSDCSDRAAIYEKLREGMDWQDWYGSNLDALWDVLTGLEHRGRRFRLLLPEDGSPVSAYAKLVRETFREAGQLEE